MCENMIRLITVLYRKSQAGLSSALYKHGLTTAEQPFFMTLHSQGRLTQEELSSIVCVDKSATARTLKSLEEKGFITREQDERDRRQNRVFLTERGRALFPMVFNEILRFNEKLTKGIGPEDLKVVYSALLKMEENAVRMTAERGTLDGCEK